MKVSGDIVVGADCSSFGNATAYVYLEDVGRIDADAQRIGVAVLDSLSHEAGVEQRIPFAVAASDVPVTREVAVRIHISRDGSEDVSAGDLVSTAHIKAETDRPVDVIVQDIR